MELAILLYRREHVRGQPPNEEPFTNGGPTAVFTGSPGDKINPKVQAYTAAMDKIFAEKEISVEWFEVGTSLNPIVRD